MRRGAEREALSAGKLELLTLVKAIKAAVISTSKYKTFLLILLLDTGFQVAKAGDYFSEDRSSNK